MPKNKLLLKKRLKETFGGKADKPEHIPANLGANIGGTKRVKVPNRPGFVYARIRGNQSEVVKAFNETVNAVYGLPVLLVHDGRYYRVIGRDVRRYEFWGGSSGYAQLGPHGGQHSFGQGTGSSGGDIVWVYKRQFMPLLTHPYAGTTVYVEDDWYVWDENIQHFLGEYVDLSNGLPSTPGDARFMTLYLDGDTNSIKGITGSTFNYSPFPVDYISYISIPTYSAGIPVGVVLLTQGMTEIDWNQLYDIRPMFSGRQNPSGTATYNTLTLDGLTANTAIYSDATKTITSLANATGSLHNNGAGSFSWVSDGHAIQDDGVGKIQTPTLDFVGNIFTVYNNAGNAKTIVSGTSYGHIILDDGVSQTQRPNLDFLGGGFVVYDDATNNKTIVSGTASGGGSAIAVYDDDVLRSAAVTGLDFLAGIDVSMSGTIAYISLNLTGTATYMLAGVPNLLTGNYWQVPSQVYATGSLSVFINGVAQSKGIDYSEQFASSGTYQLLDSPPTGSVYFAIWGIAAPQGGGGNIAKDTLWDAKGDLAVGTGADAASRLPVGATGTVLVADPTQPTGLKWSSAVAAMYQTTGTSAYPSATGTFINFPNQVYDTDSAVTVGVAWKFTAPITGYYHVDVGILYVPTTAWALGEVARLQIYKNAVAYLIMGRRDDMNSGATTQQMGLQGSCDVQLNAGDYIQVEEYQASGGNLALNANLTQNYVCIHLIR